MNNCSCQGKVRIDNPKEYYHKELKRVNEALDDAKKRCSNLQGEIWSIQKAAKIAELKQAIEAGEYYVKRIEEKVRQYAFR